MKVQMISVSLTETIEATDIEQYGLACWKIWFRLKKSKRMLQETYGESVLYCSRVRGAV